MCGSICKAVSRKRFPGLILKVFLSDKKKTLESRESYRTGIVMHLDLFVDLAVRIQRTSDSSMELKSELFLLVRMSDRCWFGS